MAGEGPAVDFEAVFRAIPTPYLVMDAGLTIVDANPSYLATTGRSRAELVGRNVFDAFPAGPSESEVDGGVSKVQASFEKARDTRLPDVMPLQEYAIPDGRGGFSQRFWSLISTPVLGEDGVCTHVVQRAEDVTDYVREQRRAEASGLSDEEWQRRLLEIESDLYARGVELTDARAAEALSARRLAALSAVALRLAGAETVAELLATVTGEGMSVFGSPGGALAVLDGDRLHSLISDQLGGEVTQRTYGTVPLDGPLPVSVATRTGQVVLLRDRAACLAFAPEMADVVAATGSVAFASLPLWSGGRTTGCLTVSWADPQVLSPGEVEVLVAFAAQCAQALDRIRTREAELRSARRLALLADVALALAGTEDVEGLTRVVMERGLEALGASGGAVAVLDEDAHELRLAITDGLGADIQDRYARLPVDGPLPVSVAVREGRQIVLHDLAEALAFAPEMAPALSQTGAQAGVALPLRTGDRIRGALSVAWSDPQRFADEDLEVLVAFAAQCAQALERVLTRQAERTALRALAGTVEALQRSLLSDPPEPDHLQVAVRYLPAARQAQVGGDWYDSFVLGDGRTVLVIGDVTGHDSYAAAAMAQVRNVLRGVAHARGGTPAEMIVGLDRAMRDLEVGTLATAVLATVEQTPADAARGERVLRWSNAGHPAPLLLHPDGRIDLLEAVPDLLLGVDPERPRSDHSRVLEPGATVLLYTDGLIERRGVPLDEGIAWLADLVAQLRCLPLEELCDRVLGELSGRVDDDVALLAIRAHAQDRPRPPSAGPVHVPEGHSALV